MNANEEEEEEEEEEKEGEEEEEEYLRSAWLAHFNRPRQAGQQVEHRRSSSRRAPAPTRRGPAARAQPARRLRLAAAPPVRDVTSRALSLEGRN